MTDSLRLDQRNQSAASVATALRAVSRVCDEARLDRPQADGYKNCKSLSSAVATSGEFRRLGAASPSVLLYRPTIEIEAAPARLAIASRCKNKVLPASTAITRSPASVATRIVSTPIMGTSKRMS